MPRRYTSVCLEILPMQFINWAIHRFLNSDKEISLAFAGTML